MVSVNQTPRSSVMRKLRWISAFAAGAPIQRITEGCITVNSPSSHLEHALISDAFGGRFFSTSPLGLAARHLMMFVSQISLRVNPFAVKTSSSISPAGPENGSAVRLSAAEGPSATIANFAVASPLPKTTFARVFAKSQAVQTLARVLRACICV